MVLMVQGSYVSDNDATAIASAIAVTSAMNNSHKTLVMQLTNNKSVSALSILKGKEIAENTITELGTYHIEDKGIDALLRRAASIKLVKETFDSSTEPMLSYENYLDIADITKKNDFVKTLSISGLKNILKYANDVYSMIIIILDGRNEEIMAQMLDLCDAYVTCIKQGPAPHAFNTCEGKKNYLAVSGFDTHSKYNLAFLKKSYGNANMFALPYNTEFHDAVISGTLLRFLLKNNDPEKEDDNSKLREAIIDLTDAVLGDKKKAEKKELEALEMEDFIRDEEDTEADLSEVSNFELETVTTEKRVFLKRTLEEKEILHIDDDLPPKKQTKFALFKKREDVKAEKEVDFESLLDTANEEEAVLPEPEEKPKKKKRRLFGRKNKRVNAEEYDFLDPEQNTAYLEDADDIPKEQEPSYEIDTDEPKYVPTADDEETKEAFLRSEESLEDLEATGAATKNLKKEKEAIESHVVKISSKWICPECHSENTGKFCTECGHGMMESWCCPECGELNTGKFCSECGTKRG